MQNQNVCCVSCVFQWGTGGWAILRKRLTMLSMLAQQHRLSLKL